MGAGGGVMVQDEQIVGIVAEATPHWMLTAINLLGALTVVLLNAA
ncbi:putative protein OS=Bosea thiooxidans OX=53254 GN=SAMN05660750_03426 PE=4 SV=1 [Bosea thiooxidans]|uniref:Uncharacterized protein n=1 Tax=Bosea thiooxidans TaxID=53254 RepID=A0A1T5FP05_9HYPH|nr:hypothetical protein SAMN05660750_03426 [Bosea thiooxidans]